MKKSISLFLLAALAFLFIAVMGYLGGCILFAPPAPGPATINLAQKYFDGQELPPVLFYSLLAQDIKEIPFEEAKKWPDKVAFLGENQDSFYLFIGRLRSNQWSASTKIRVANDGRYSIKSWKLENSNLIVYYEKNGGRLVFFSLMALVGSLMFILIIKPN